MVTRFRVVLLDLDGTLVDSVVGIHDAACETARALEVPEPSPTFVRNAIGRGVDRLLHRVVSGRQDGEVSVELHRRAREIFDRIYARTCLSGTVLRDGCGEALESLRAQGRRLVVATNKPRRPATLVLEATGLDRLVDDLVCPEDAGVVKPSSGFVRHAVGASSLRESLLVGDSSVDAATATGAGIPFIAIRGGYDEGRDIGRHRPLPDVVIETPRGLPGAVRSLEV